MMNDTQRDMLANSFDEIDVSVSKDNTINIVVKATGPIPVAQLAEHYMNTLTQEDDVFSAYVSVSQDTVTIEIEVDVDFGDLYTVAKSFADRITEASFNFDFSIMERHKETSE